MGRALFIVALTLTACPLDPPEKAVCEQIVEDNAPGHMHCATDKVTCERALSKNLYEGHKKRCNGPCTYSAHVDCVRLTERCTDGSSVEFMASEHLRCQR